METDTNSPSAGAKPRTSWKKGEQPAGVKVCLKHGDVVFAKPCRLCQLTSGLNRALQGA